MEEMEIVCNDFRKTCIFKIFQSFHMDNIVFLPAILSFTIISLFLKKNHGLNLGSGTV